MSNCLRLCFAGGRTNIASCSLGAAQWAVEEAIEYTANRKQFNKRIIDFQNTQFKISEMASELFSIRLTVRAAAREIDDNRPEGVQGQISAASAAAAAKLLATEKCYTIIDNCLQVQ